MRAEAIRLLAILTVLPTLSSPASDTIVSVAVAPPVVVGAALDEHQLYEPQLAVDPTNPNHWLAVTMVSGVGATFQEQAPKQTCTTFLPLDNGRTWERHDLKPQRCWDPWVAFMPSGVALISLLSDDSNTLLVLRSEDGGRTWDERPVSLGPGHDHPVVTVDRSTRRGWIYITSHRSTRAEDGTRRWGPFVARSRDGGKTFDDPVAVVPNNLHNLAEMPVVLSDGTLIVSFVDASHPSKQPNGTNFERRRAWVLRSIDGGHAFSIPLFVTDACGPPPGFRLSALVADLSTVYRDQLYFACRERGAGRIVVSHSADRGEVWSDPIPASSDNPAVAERIPGMAVNNRGALAVAWIDGQSGTGHHCEEAVYVAASDDGGATFSPATTVATVKACADSVTVRSETGGDYFGLVAAPDGTFRLLWSETPDGHSRLMTTAVTVR